MKLMRCLLCILVFFGSGCTENGDNETETPYCEIAFEQTYPAGYGKMVYDKARDTIVFVSIFTEFETHEYSNNRWTEIQTNNQPPITGDEDNWDGGIWFELVYYEKESTVFLFGANTSTRFMWQYDGSDWRELPVDTLPLAYGNMVFDSGQQHILYTGGASDSYKQDNFDLWSYDGENWQKIYENVSSEMPEVHEINLVYDPEKNSLVLTGTFHSPDTPEAYVWTWEFNGQQWIETDYFETYPWGHSSLVYDSTMKAIYMVETSTIYKYESGIWREVYALNQLTTPSWSAIHGFFLNVVDNASAGVLYIYNFHHFFTYSETSGWYSIPSDFPNVNAYYSLSAYFPQKAVVTLFDYDDQTWLWDGSSYTKSEANFPAFFNDSEKLRSRLLYDPESQTLLLFWPWDGFTTYAYDGHNWEHMDTENGPQLSYVLAVHDTIRNSILFMGNNWGDDTIQIWEFKNYQWDQIGTEHSPPTSNVTKAYVAYDEDAQKTVLFTDQARTWEFDGADWIKISPSVSPPIIEGGMMNYDPTCSRIILTGGQDTAGKFVEDLWQYRDRKWTSQEIGGAKLERINAGFTYDAARKRHVIIGGRTGSSALVMELYYQ